MTAEVPVLEASGITVRFPGHVALDDVQLRLFPGEVHSLMGENGAGKSTLVKAITGVQQVDAGTIRIQGRPVVFAGAAEATAAGVAAVYQEIDLLPHLSVAENIMLGAEPHRFGTIDWKATRRSAGEALAELGLSIDLDAPLRSYDPGSQQLIAIARALREKPAVLVLDEPTSSLDQDEVTDLFRVIRMLRQSGVAILFISHFLEQVYEIADRITVLRNGHVVGEYLTTELLRIDLVEKMLGRSAAALSALSGDRSRERSTQDQDADDGVVLTARGLGRSPAIAPFDLTVREGEIVGFAGLLGSGRTDAARLIAGIDRADQGSIALDGVSRRFGSPRQAIRRGVIYSPEDRASHGIIAELTVRENIVLALQADRGWLHPLSFAQQTELAESYIDALRITPADPEARAGTLSGGNQQKVLLARSLALAPRVLLLDEPTRGIDVGAKVEVQRLIASLAENGMSVVFISSELEEVLRLSDRIMVLHDRSVVAVVANDGIGDDQLLALIAQGSGSDD